VTVSGFITHSQTDGNNMFRRQLFNYSFHGSVSLKRISKIGIAVEKLKSLFGYLVLKD